MTANASERTRANILKYLRGVESAKMADIVNHSGVTVIPACWAIESLVADGTLEIVDNELDVDRNATRVLLVGTVLRLKDKTEEV